MTHSASSSVVRQIARSLFDGGAVAGLSDRQLIDRFNASRDAAGEAAFAAIVRRHGPMVLDVCRQIVGWATRTMLEDAFQAAVPRPGEQGLSDPAIPTCWAPGFTA